jgi:ribose transport system permease protein
VNSSTMRSITTPVTLWLRRVSEQGILIPAVFLTILLSVYAVTTPGALELSQLRYTLFNASLALALAAAGLSLVVLVGGLDLSSGGVITAVNAILTVYYGGGLVNQLIWILGMIIFGVAFGAVNGIIVQRFQLEPVVVTLASGFILTGAALLVLPEPAGLQTIDGPSILEFLTSSVVGVPVSLILIALVALGWVFLRRSRVGTWIFALGSDAEGAAYTGVPIARTRILAFAAAGGLYALAGVAVTSQTSGGDPKLGASYVLAAFAAVVVGGVRLGGGAGSLVGAVFGAMAITISVSVLLSLGFATYWSTIARGIFLLLAIGAQAILFIALQRLSRRTRSIQIKGMP